jgi:hypothetical protein
MKIRSPKSEVRKKSDGRIPNLADRAQIDTPTIINSLSPQRSAGRGDFELKTSSPRPSPPASLGAEGVISRFDSLKFNPLTMAPGWVPAYESFCSDFQPLSNFGSRISEFETSS